MILYLLFIGGESTEFIVTTEDKTLESFQDTIRIEDFVAGKSTKTTAIDVPTDSITAITSAHTIFVAVTTDILIPTKTDSLFYATKMIIVTRKSKSAKRIITDYDVNPDTCGTFTITDEQCTAKR